VKKQNGMFNPRWLISSVLLILLLAGCAQSSEPCPPYVHGDLSGVDAFAGDDQLPFRFPLDGFAGDTAPIDTGFCAGSRGESARKYHAAEDYGRPAGTPVYAMADGNISFSGLMGGYGWLIIVDHPQANLYSLYGHLSPSRWYKGSGTVEKGELIAYLGDSDENGGSAKDPLYTHLHFGVRAGQRADYPGTSQWRWMAGWIAPCPQDLGWLQPSVIIASQEIPVGGFPGPAAGFVTIWGLDLLFAGIYLFGGACILVYAIRKDKPLVLVANAIAFTVAAWIFHNKRMATSYVLVAMAVLFLAIGVYRSIRRSAKTSRTQS